MTEVEKKEPVIVLCQFCAAVISESGSVSERRILDAKTCSACDSIPEDERPRPMSADEMFESYVRSVIDRKSQASSSSIEETSNTPVSALSSTSDSDS